MKNTNDLEKEELALEIKNLEDELDERYRNLGKKIVEISTENSNEINKIVDEIIVLKKKYKGDDDYGAK